LVNLSGFGDPRVSVSEMDFHPNRGSGRVRVSVLGAQRLHLIRTHPVAILTLADITDMANELAVLDTRV
jgi:hypothetical protein